jgi:pSer/pThr/pTyr-binding forkhead associated (FHA) protein
MSAQIRPERRETTQGVSLREIGADIPAPQAALMLNGSRNIPLKAPVVNIGRQRDNDVILDHPGVSRHHAQLRLRFGRYMLFDLGSTRGTTVNGQPIRETILQSGDVIRMAGVTLIYVEEAPAPSAPTDMGGTQPFSPLK